ncbi:hypothetical protein E4T38_09115 [Aureobasidium subglaciale]|nr:hypothetical protein E4T38_09115 [Aureobasidium subglaciale]KAI5214429.1 hypothetical protein E4T40_09014 [Aureobasidium subglaciale]KAI5216996.1 hypothetical protein E4T41_09016 [Aureobasidium subglaciale]KAI5254730.1 hypothetical protein E4T46_09050 [Aureobasidium subglaciale]
MQSATLLQDLGRHADTLRQIVFSSDSRLLVNLSLCDDPINIWDPSDGQLQSSTAGCDDITWDVTFSEDSQHMITANDDGLARLWNTTTGDLIRQFGDEEGDRMYAAAFTPDGRSVATGTDVVQIWDIESGTLRHTLIGYDDRRSTGVSIEAMDHAMRDSHEIWSIDFSPEAKYLISVSFRLWDIVDWDLMFTSQGNALWFSPNGTVFVTAGHGIDTQVWDTITFELRYTLQGSGGVFSPNSELIATTGRDHTISLRNLETGQFVKTLKGYGTAQPSVMFTPDSETMITNSGKIIHIWNVATGELQYLLEDHTEKILALALSPNSNILASGSRDHTVRLWNIASGVCLQTLEGHGDEVWGVAFSPDGTRLVTSSDHGIVKLWEIHQP